MTDEESKALVAGSNLAILEIVRILHNKGLFSDADWTQLISSLADVAGDGELKASQQASIDRMAMLLARFHPNENLRLKS